MDQYVGKHGRHHRRSPGPGREAAKAQSGGAGRGDLPAAGPPRASVVGLLDSPARDVDALDLEADRSGPGSDVEDIWREPADPASVTLSSAQDELPVTPVPAAFDCELTRPIRTVRQRTRRPLRTALFTLFVVGVLVVVAGSAGLAYLKGLVNDIPKIGGEDLQVAPAQAGAATTYLIVGNDTREGLDEEIASDAGVGRAQTAGQRADTVMVVHVDPARKKAFVLSLPRDLLVEIPGRGPDKLNAALAYDPGEQLLVDTIQAYTGLTINHYIEVNFESFRQIVDAVGGVEYDFPYPVRDTQLKWEFPAGQQVLDGREALQLVRSRHFQEEIDGRWRSDNEGDFGRIKRQQEFLLKLVAKMNGAGSVTRMKEFARIAKEHMKVDENFDFDAALELYREMTPVTPENVEFVDLPAEPTAHDGVSYIEATPEAAAVLARLRGEISGETSGETSSGAPEAVDPAVLRGETRVRVLNGSDQKALAANTRLRLDHLGFGGGTIGDAPTPREMSVVYYGPGAEEKGRLVADGLHITDLQPGTVGNTDVLVILGDDFRLPEAAPSE